MGTCEMILMKLGHWAPLFSWVFFASGRDLINPRWSSLHHCLAVTFPILETIFLSHLCERINPALPEKTEMASSEVLAMQDNADFSQDAPPRPPAPRTPLCFQTQVPAGFYSWGAMFDLWGDMLHSKIAPWVLWFIKVENQEVRCKTMVEEI